MKLLYFLGAYVLTSCTTYGLQLYAFPKLHIPTLSFREVMFIYAIWFMVKIINTGLMAAFHAEGKKK